MRPWKKKIWNGTRITRITRTGFGARPRRRRVWRGGRGGIRTPGRWGRACGFPRRPPRHQPGSARLPGPRAQRNRRFKVWSAWSAWSASR